jgi:hypothetical protein
MSSLTARTRRELHQDQSSAFLERQYPAQQVSPPPPQHTNQLQEHKSPSGRELVQTQEQAPVFTRPLGPVRNTRAFEYAATQPMDPARTVHEEAAKARAAVLDRERRQIFGYLASPNCYLFSDVQGAVSLTEEDLDLLLAAGGTSSATLAHLRHLDTNGHKFSGFSALIPAVQNEHLAALDSKKAILEYLSSPACRLFGNPANSPLSGTPVFLTVADVDRLADEGGAGSETEQYLKAFDAAGE